MVPQVHVGRAHVRRAQDTCRVRTCGNTRQAREFGVQVSGGHRLHLKLLRTVHEGASDDVRLYTLEVVMRGARE